MPISRYEYGAEARLATHPRFAESGREILVSGVIFASR